MQQLKRPLYLVLLCFLTLTSKAERYIVNSLTDTGIGVENSGDLRYCLTQVNQDPTGPDTIIFEVGGTIQLTGQLPPPSNQVYINGSTAPFFEEGQPQVILSGFILALVNPNSQGSHIQGLVIQNSIGNGLEINGVDDLLIEDCFIGTNENGTLPSPNLANGLLAVNTSNLHVKKSVISGNLANGIFLENDSCVLLEACHIGLNAFGTTSVANGAHGILALNTPQIKVQNSTISGNNAMGAVLTNCPASVFAGCKIGTSQEGSTAVANGLKGIELWGGTDDVIIGGSTAESANVISGNTLDGISLMGTTKSHIRIEGNIIGLNAEGTAALPNDKGITDYSEISTQGLQIFNNTIAGNGFDLGGEGSGQGINLVNVTDLVIQGNRLGTDPTGMVSIPNGHNSIDLNDCDDVLIGGPDASHRNLISGTTDLALHGIILQGENRCNNATIQNNYIGTNVEGRNMGTPTNRGYGIVCKGDSARIFDNIVSGNGQWGILITDGQHGVIRDNLVGVDIDGHALGNGYGGIAVRKESEYIPWETTDNAILHNVVAHNGFDFQYFGQGASPVPNGFGPGIGLGIMEWTQGNPFTDRILISENTVYCNAGKGIDLNLTQDNAAANDGKQAPEITFIADFIQGTSTPGDTIEVYEVGSCSECGEYNLEGALYLQKITADETGFWVFDGVQPDVQYTFLARDTTHNTSEFAGCPRCIYPIVDLGDDVEVPVGSTSVELRASAEISDLYGPRELSYSWTSAMDDDEVSTPTAAQTEVTPTVTETEYYIQVSDGACTSFDTVLVILDFDIFIPSGFSPNNDGDNDGFQIKNAGRFPENSLKIYNRWGTLVYESEGYGVNDTWWVGTSEDGEDLPMATYFYVFQASNEDDSQAGPVTIVR